MKYSALITISSDTAFMVPKDKFERHFSQYDFAQRDVIDVEDYYRSDWFHLENNGNAHFIVPTINILNGETQFINGRHRTAVLYKFTNEVPMAFTEGQATEFALKIGLAKLSNSFTFYLPDLPVMEHVSE